MTCTEKVYVDVNGKPILPPRSCKHRAKVGGMFCGLHLKKRGSITRTACCPSRRTATSVARRC